MSETYTDWALPVDNRTAWGETNPVAQTPSLTRFLCRPPRSPLTWQQTWRLKETTKAPQIGAYISVDSI